MTNIEQGRTLRVDPALVANAGDQSGDQTIILTVDDGSERQVDATTGVQLSSGERTAITSLTWDTTFESTGNYTLRLTSDDDTASTTVTVVTAEGFVVSITSTNEPVTEGETLDVEYSVTNEGGSDDTQTVFLQTDGTVRDSAEVTLSPGAVSPGTLSWDTSSGDAGDYTATVESEDDSDSTSVTVQDPVGSDPTPDWETTISKSSGATPQDLTGASGVVGVVTFGDTGSEGHLTALNASDGSHKWENTATNTTFGNVVHQSDSFTLGTNDGDLFNYDAQDGSTNETFSTSDTTTYNHYVEASEAAVEDGGDVALIDISGNTLATASVNGFSNGFRTDGFVIAGNTYVEGFEIVPDNSGGFTLDRKYTKFSVSSTTYGTVSNGNLYGLLEKSSNSSAKDEIFSLDISSGTTNYRQDIASRSSDTVYYHYSIQNDAVYTGEGSTVAGYNGSTGTVAFAKTLSLDGAMKGIARAGDKLHILEDTDPPKVSAYDLY